MEIIDDVAQGGSILHWTSQIWEKVVSKRLWVIRVKCSYRMSHLSPSTNNHDAQPRNLLCEENEEEKPCTFRADEEDFETKERFVTRRKNSITPI